MPREPNKALRIIVPLIAIAGGIALAIGVGMSSKRTSSPAPAAPPPAQQQAQQDQGAIEEPAAQESLELADDTSSLQPPGPIAADAGAEPPVDDAAPNESAVDSGALAARVYLGDVPPVVLGSLDPALGFELEVELTPYGAGVSSAKTTNHYVTIRDRVNAQRDAGPAENYTIQTIAEQAGATADGAPITYRMSAMGVTAITLDGERIELFGGSYGRVWDIERHSPNEAVWKAEIIDGETGEAVAILRRTYTLNTGSFELIVAQSIENLTSDPIAAIWEQFGALDLPRDTSGYRLTMQRVRFGYRRMSQPSTIHADGALRTRDSYLSDIQRDAEKRRVSEAAWPHERYDDAGSLVWTAQTNRYFMAAVYPVGQAAQDLPLGAAVRSAVLFGPNDGTRDDDRLALRLSTPVFQLAPGAQQSLDVAFYPGPKDDRRLASGDDPGATAVELDKIVIHNMGGFCAWCTFAWLADILLAVLRFFTSLSHDWAISIILLVICVRAALHPIFKKSQIGIQRFGKQMQRIAPKQKKLQEKFKDDPKRLRLEIQKLMREEQVSYAGLFGCLPMFLQSPIWIALYAMLYTDFELRHEAAFYGIFQQFGGWTFLADLSRGDAFIPLPFSFELPLMGTITAINVLPLLLGVVFFIHQKYLTPPSTGTMTPEQEQTQKIMKVMMVVMFPIFMYNAPAALSLYFVTNSTLGIIEGRWIRAHMDAMDLDGTQGPDGRKQVTNTAGAKPTLEERLRARLEAKHPPKRK